MKTVVMGHTGVGKTSLVLALSSGNPKGMKADEIPTVFNNAALSAVYGDASLINVSLWDTEMWGDISNMGDMLNERWSHIVEESAQGLEGGESYEKMRRLTFPDTDVFLHCFSITDRESFDGVWQKWLPDVKKWMPATKYIHVLVATKSDLADKRVVSTEEALASAKEAGFYAYVECSSVAAVNVDKVLLACIEGAMAHLPTPMKDYKDSLQFGWLEKEDWEDEDTYLDSDEDIIELVERLQEKQKVIIPHPPYHYV